jgi:uncharacterized protein YbaP (TraB family)
LAKESYLFGTIHLICKEDFKFDQTAKKALEQADQLWLELDLDDPTLSGQMQQLSIREGMRNMSEKITPEDAKVLDDYFTTNYGVGLAQLGVLKPFVLSTMVLMKEIPCTETENFEYHLVSLAKEQQKPIEGLETVAFQMSVFDSIPESLQIQELVTMIQDNSAADDFRGLIEMYLSQDVEKLWAEMTDEGMFASYRSLLLDQRNQKWVEKIIRETKESSLFIAVGSGHLAGDQGVINLLRNQGYNVEPIYSNAN